MGVAAAPGKPLPILTSYHWASQRCMKSKTSWQQGSQLPGGQGLEAQGPAGRGGRGAGGVPLPEGAGGVTAGPVMPPGR